MALEDQTTIDMISKPDAVGKICLVITDAGVTTDPDTRFELLAKKLQAYARAVLNGDLAMDYPDKQPGDFFIRVVCANPPTDAMKNISSVGQSENPMPVVFETWNPANNDAAEQIPPADIPTAAGPTSRQPSFSWRMVLLIALPIVAIAGYFGYQLYQLNSFPPGYRNRPASGWGERPGEQEFDKADAEIDSYQGTTAFGNSPAAIVLAQQFSETLKAAREELFTRGLGIELFESTEGEFLTYCELHDGECAFIVHVPRLRHFEKNFTEKVDARKLLAQAAWLSAQKVLRANHAGKIHMELAVGLRGINQYGPMMLGYYMENLNSPEDGIVKYLDDYTLSNFLWEFFAPAAGSDNLSKKTDLQSPSSKTSDAKISDVTVLSAEFGLGAHYVGVTTRVIDLLHTQPDGFAVNPKSLQRNPLPNRNMHLKIRYDYKGNISTLIIPTGTQVSYQFLVNKALTNAAGAPP